MSSSAVTVDRALMAVMVYSFARINALLKMKVRDYFVQGRRGWVPCTRKAARNMRFPAITIWNSTSTNTSPPPASPAPMRVLANTTGARSTFFKVLTAKPDRLAAKTPPVVADWS